MNPKDLKTHIHDHYRLLFEGKRSSSIAVEAGRPLAGSLGYPVDRLEFVPDRYWDRFHPCGNPLPYLTLASGDRVLNLGCGAGIDAFALATAFDTPLHIVNLDIVYPVLRDARELAFSRFPGERLQWVCSDGDCLPFRSNAFDWILMNGVFNLFADKPRLLEEVRRTLKPSGTLVVTDLCCTSTLPEYFTREKDGWAWCMSGACTEEQLSALLQKTGFCRFRILQREEEDGEMFHRFAFSCAKASRPHDPPRFAPAQPF